MSTSPINAVSSRPGVYARGAETVDLILKAALEVLLDEGAGGFSLRRIAAKCGMKVGNLSYHFPRKEALIQLMLEELLDSYSQLLDRTVRQPGLSAEHRLAGVIDMCLDDIQSKRTTHLFTELWALANHNAFVADRVEAFYRRVHEVISEYVRELNPVLKPDEVQVVALYISASMEGTTPFLGYGKPWHAQMGRIRNLSTKMLVHLAKTVTPGDIRGPEAPVPLKPRPRKGESARKI
jgi:AcrR family transcriptional regulator